MTAKVFTPRPYSRHERRASAADATAKIEQVQQPPLEDEIKRQKRLDAKLAYRERNREKLAAKQREYNARNAEAISERRREARLNWTEEQHEQHRKSNRASDARLKEVNRESDLAYFRAYREANRVELRAKQRARRAANPEPYREHYRRWREKNPDQARQRYRDYYQANRARLISRSAKRDDMDPEWFCIVACDPCAYCGGPCEHIDHITPVVEGGTGAWTNLTASCARCNQTKHTKPLLTFLLGELNGRYATEQPGHPGDRQAGQQASA